MTLNSQAEFFLHVYVGALGRRRCGARRPSIGTSCAASRYGIYKWFRFDCWPIGRCSFAADCRAVARTIRPRSTSCMVHVWNRFAPFWKSSKMVELCKSSWNWEIAMSIPFERFRCKIQQWVRVQLHPVALPWGYRRLSAVFEHCFASHTTLHQAAVGMQWEIIVWNDMITIRFKEWNGCDARTTPISNGPLATLRRQFICWGTPAAICPNRWLVAHQQWVVQKMPRLVHLTYIVLVAGVRDAQCAVAVDEGVGGEWRYLTVGFVENAEKYSSKLLECCRAENGCTSGFDGCEMWLGSYAKIIFTMTITDIIGDGEHRMCKAKINLKWCHEHKIYITKMAQQKFLIGHGTQSKGKENGQ